MTFYISINNFGEQRDIRCLEQDLLQLKINKNESLHSFGTRCSEIRSILMAKLIQLNQSTHEKTLLPRHYERLTLDTYVRNLLPTLQMMIRIKKISSLEDAIKTVAKEENFSYYSRSMSALIHPKFSII